LFCARGDGAAFPEAGPVHIWALHRGVWVFWGRRNDVVLHAGLSNLFNGMVRQMTILTEFEIKGYFAKGAVQWFLSCPGLSTVEMWARSNFRSLLSYFPFLWTWTLKMISAEHSRNNGKNQVT